jgi:peptidoglycan/xylan/chitin deacetylase (PgdA/CDA1 family)
MHPITRLKSALGAFAKPFVLNRWVMKDRFPIFMFHRVVEEGTVDGTDEHLTVTKGAFEETIVFLNRHFQIVDIMEAVERTRSNGRPVCVLTFDDGWRDSYDMAFPILKKHAVPATFFLCAGLVGTNHLFWFERVQNLVNEVAKSKDGFARLKSYSGSLFSSEVLKDIHDNVTLLWQINHRLKGLHPARIDDWLNKTEAHFSITPDEKRNLLNWEEIREMSKNNISFGSHGMSHSILTVLSKEEKQHELEQSKKILSERGINFVPAISFPNGNYDQETINIAEKVGYKVLLTASINQCGNGESQSLYHRINISRSTTLNLNLIFYNIARARMKRKL